MTKAATTLQDREVLFRMRRTVNGIRITIYVIGGLCVFAFLNNYVAPTSGGQTSPQQALWFLGLTIASQIIAAFLSLFTTVLISGAQLAMANWKGSLEASIEAAESVELEVRRQTSQKLKSRKPFSPWMQLSCLLLYLAAYVGMATWFISVSAVTLVALNIYRADRKLRKES